MSNKAAISLTTGLEDPEKVTVALLVAVGAAEAGKPTLLFLTKEAVRLATEGVAVGVACDGCPDLPGLFDLMAAAGDCVTRAVGHAMLAATSVTTPRGEIRSWRDAFPSAVTGS